jgi:putative acetyltransferase
MIMEIRPYKESDYIEIADLFHSAVHSIDSALYSQEEIEAWAPTPLNYQFWKARLLVKKPFLAIKDSIIVGFVELEIDGHIDCLYVHPDFQSKGVGKALVNKVLKVANERGVKRLYVEASKVAKPLFEQFGFELLQTNRVSLNGQILINYSMSLSEIPRK